MWYESRDKYSSEGETKCGPAQERRAKNLDLIVKGSDSLSDTARHPKLLLLLSNNATYTGALARSAHDYGPGLLLLLGTIDAAWAGQNL